MFDVETASTGVKLALLEGQLLSSALESGAFIAAAEKLGASRAVALETAEKYTAIASNQKRLRENLRANYDYIIIGSGASGSVIARRLADKMEAQILLLEAGGNNIEPGVLIPETWVFNQTGPLDWNFAAAPSARVNNRSIVQAAGRVLGGSTSINGMVWARGHRNDFEDRARLSGDATWGYKHGLLYLSNPCWRVSVCSS